MARFPRHIQPSKNGISKYSWLKEFLELPNGIPSDDTFRRVFERIKPEEFERVFQNFINSKNGVVYKLLLSLKEPVLFGIRPHTKFNFIFLLYLRMLPF